MMFEFDSVWHVFDKSLVGVLTNAPTENYLWRAYAVSNIYVNIVNGVYCQKKSHNSVEQYGDIKVSSEICSKLAAAAPEHGHTFMNGSHYLPEGLYQVTTTFNDGTYVFIFAS